MNYCNAIISFDGKLIGLRVYDDERLHKTEGGIGSYTTWVPVPIEYAKDLFNKCEDKRNYDSNNLDSLKFEDYIKGKGF